MRIFIASLILLTTVYTVAQESAEQKLSDFESLIVQGRFTVDIKQSDDMRSVAVKHSPEVDLDKLSYTYTGKKLTIKYSGSLLNDVDLHLTLYVKKFSYIEAKQGAEVRVDKKFDFKDQPLTLKADSGGKLSVNIEAPWVVAEITKGGSIRVTGKTEVFTAEIKTGGTIGAAHLESETVNAKISLGGEIICYPLKHLDAQVTSGGTISYKGKPSVDQKIRLGGTIESI
ncbi:MAG: DUF2807 domain-containing protein [Brumimicrobium sp.]|nr:DUF2807 domain-containing protein [Brumimicrobium sp.]